MRIYDCSNSAERPAHRGGGGPKMNDVMRYLRENASAYACEFVDSHETADVIITNDVFPSDIPDSIPKVKRMCAPFFQTQLATRNEALNKAAKQADKVIFITEYSKRQYLRLYGDDLKSHCVVKHWVDPTVYRYTPKPKFFGFAACATDWSREEKRLDSLDTFARHFPMVSVMLIGKVDTQLPGNVISTGYHSDKGIAYRLNYASAFINLSYRDAATKTVCQAISCGLPVLYADSGGVGEMVGECGMGIKDSQSLDMEDDIPSLALSDVWSAFDKFSDADVFPALQAKARSFDSQAAFQKMLDGYFNAIWEVL